MSRPRKRTRERNPRRGAILYAKRTGGPLLKYTGRGKFAVKGRPRVFPTRAAADLAAWVLKDTFPVLAKYRLFSQ